MSPSRRRRPWLLTGCGVLLVATAVWALSSDPAPELSPPAPVVQLRSTVPAPQSWRPAAWRPYFAALSWNRAALAELDALPGDVLEASAAEAAARGAVAAQVLADPGARVGYESYLADPFGPRGVGLELDPAREHRFACRDFDVAATAVAALPWDAKLAKAVVLWSGDCIDGLTSQALGGAPRDASLYQASEVYLRRDAQRWVPVRESALPGSASGRQDSGAQTPAYLLAPLRCAGQTGLRGQARVEVVEAMASLCEAAQAAGVRLSIDGGLRSSDAQRAYEDSHAGARALAEQRGSGTRCTNLHCTGWAVDVSGAQALAWLAQTVACEQPGGAVVSASSCGEGARPVSRAVSHGIALGPEGARGHLTYVLPPTMFRWSASCDPDPAQPVPTILATVWRCRLGQAGLSRELAREAVARALVVSRCVSGWDPRAVTTGAAVRRVGLFGLDPADRSVGRSGPLRDPAVNADVAARRFLAAARRGEDGFAAWGQCGANLPASSGGMPAWAYAW